MREDRIQALRTFSAPTAATPIDGSWDSSILEHQKEGDGRDDLHERAEDVGSFGSLVGLAGQDRCVEAGLPARDVAAVELGLDERECGGANSVGRVTGLLLDVGDGRGEVRGLGLVGEVVHLAAETLELFGRHERGGGGLHAIARTASSR